MKVHVGILRHVVVEDNVYSLDVHTTTKQVCSYEDSLLEIFELLITVQPKIIGR